MISQEAAATNQQDRVLRKTIVCAASFIIALGGAMAAAWHLKIAWPEKVIPGFFDMKYNTSLCFVAAGAGLLAALAGSKRYTLAGGAVILTLGALTLAEYLWDRSLGIDQLFLVDQHGAGGPYPGRMSPGTSLAFALAGALFLLAGSGNWGRPWRGGIKEFLGFLVFALGAEGAIGHLRGNVLAYDWGSQARMSPQTAVCFMALGIGLLALAWQRQGQGQERPIARIPLWVPGLLCFFVLLFDLSTPRGVSGGIAYLPLIFCSLWFLKPRMAFVFAAVGSVLTVLAFFAKPPGNIDLWIVVLNRGTTLLALWIMAAALFYFRRKTDATLAQLQRSEAVLRAMTEASQDAVVAMDQEGHITEWNRQAEVVFGWPREAAIGMLMHVLIIPPARRARHLYRLKEFLETGAGAVLGRRIELTLLNSTGAEFPCELTMTATKLGEKYHFSAFIRDITARKVAEETVRRYTHALERSNEDLQEFVHIASHDLKEPLRGLNNHAALLARDYAEKLDEKGLHRLSRLTYLSTRMGQLIDDLLYFSRLARSDIDLQAADPNLLVEDIRQMLEPFLKERNARITVPRPLPEISCDRVRVTEVFRNLITNAVKYNDKPEKTVEIGFLDRMDTARGPERNVFYVKDNGIGIEMEFHNDIFLLFKRLDRPAEAREPGTGVGLTFVKKIIERHQGRIWLDSVPGGGATFYFTVAPEAPLGDAPAYLETHPPVEGSL